MYKIIVNCLGGLGNQMSQYAFYKELEFRGYNVEFYIGGFESYNLHNYELEKVFNVDINYANKKDIAPYFSIFAKILRRLKLSNGGLILQKHFEYYEPYLHYYRDSYLIGYWQSESYFSNVCDDIRDKFKFPPLNSYNLPLSEKINNSNSVSLHIRRGDYVGHELYDGICNLDYYKRAIVYMRERIKTPLFFVFSNDINWCKLNLGIDDVEYVSGNTGVNNYCDMQLMSLCKHNILANSSFSWWGAWLNNNPHKLVIVPRKFFNGDMYNETDIYPSSWIKL